MNEKVILMRGLEGVEITRNGNSIIRRRVYEEEGKLYDGGYVDSAVYKTIDEADLRFHIIATHLEARGYEKIQGHESAGFTIPADIKEQIEWVAEQVEKTNPGQRLFIGKVPYSGYQANGDVWVEIISTRTVYPSGYKATTVRTLTGNKIFQEACGGDQWMPSDRDEVPSNSLNHCANVQHGQVVTYFGKPFSKAAPLTPDIDVPDWLSDPAEVKIRQQELKQEQDAG